MPLVEGYSEAAIAENIRRLVAEGKSQAQATAIALQKAEEARRKAKK